uniref:Ig-like domain-containing protein n=1 Tax=Labrus bergylta TaxID=56723 RepID=A0A3Q3FXF8_9LABR
TTAPCWSQQCMAQTDNVLQPEGDVEEGGNINLTCTYDGLIQNIQWYRQNQRSRPEFLLYITEGGTIHPTDSDFSAYINKTEKRVNLEISSAALTDSAVYYCALKAHSDRKHHNSLDDRLDWSSNMTLSAGRTEPS